jgi:hypothetical protein
MRVWSVATGAQKEELDGGILAFSKDRSSEQKVGKYTITFHKDLLLISEGQSVVAFFRAPYAISAVGSAGVRIGVGCSRIRFKEDVDFLQNYWKYTLRRLTYTCGFAFGGSNVDVVQAQVVIHAPPTSHTAVRFMKSLFCLLDSVGEVLRVLCIATCPVCRLSFRRGGTAPAWSFFKNFTRSFFYFCDRPS